MAEEEVTMEVEAVRAVYGDDCKILNMYPPHIEVRVKPRTADVSSQQFVEAAVQIFAGSQYPNELPQINITRSKGLDKTRLQDLNASLQDRAHELASSSMLIALCEEAVERLSTMNHPDGDCPLCLYPFVPWDEKNELVSVMKLMSCFHCFHSHCIIQWWKWLLMESDLNCEHSVCRILPSLREKNHQAMKSHASPSPATLFANLRWLIKWLKHSLTFSQGVEDSSSRTAADNRASDKMQQLPNTFNSAFLAQK